jgi:hypothetical protein
MEYERMIVRLQMDKERELLEMSRFLSSKGLWEEYNNYLRETWEDED